MRPPKAPRVEPGEVLQRLLGTRADSRIRSGGTATPDRGGAGVRLDSLRLRRVPRDSPIPPHMGRVPRVVRRSGMASVTGSEDARRVWRTVAVPVTSACDCFEHLVREEGMTPGSAGCYVAVCGRSVRAAALVCPPGPRCPACTSVRSADAGGDRRRRRCLPGLWVWLKPVRRRRYRAAGAMDSASDGD